MVMIQWYEKGMLSSIEAIERIEVIRGQCQLYMVQMQWVVSLILLRKRMRLSGLGLLSLDTLVQENRNSGNIYQWNNAYVCWTTYCK